MTKTSKYTYDGSYVLVNVHDIKDEGELKEFETTVTGTALAKMQLTPVMGQLDFAHLCKIHQVLFEDVYQFAGKLREENIAKDYFVFCPSSNIISYATDLFRNLKNENYLKGLDEETFAERAGEYLAEINILHPFREGNGRTQREFIRLVALNAGYELEWANLEKGEMIEASKRSVVNSDALAKVIRKAMVKK